MGGRVNSSVFFSERFGEWYLDSTEDGTKYQIRFFRYYLFLAVSNLLVYTLSYLIFSVFFRYQMWLRLSLLRSFSGEDGYSRFSSRLKNLPLPLTFFGSTRFQVMGKGK